MDVKDAFEKTTAVLLEEVPVVITGATLHGACSNPLADLGEAVLGTIGFGGDELRGSVVLVAQPSVWRGIGPAGFAADTLSSAQLCDMVGELCNMLVGRFKKRLLRCGIEIACGMPTATYGHLAVPRLPTAAALHVATFRVETPVGPIFVRTDVLFRDDFVFPAETVSGIEPAETDLFF
jgi:hypothetical protein